MIHLKKRSDLVVFDYLGYKIVKATWLTRFLFGNSKTNYFILRDRKFFPCGSFHCLESAVGAFFGFGFSDRDDLIEAICSRFNCFPCFVDLHE